MVGGVVAVSGAALAAGVLPSVEGVGSVASCTAGEVTLRRREAAFLVRVDEIAVRERAADGFFAVGVLAFSSAALRGTEYAPVAASCADGVYCAAEYLPATGVGESGALYCAVVCELTGAFGIVWMTDENPCVSWLSVSSAKRACTCAATSPIGCEVIRSGGVELVGGDAGAVAGCHVVAEGTLCD